MIWQTLPPRPNHPPTHPPTQNQFPLGKSEILDGAKNETPILGNTNFLVLSYPSPCPPPPVPYARHQAQSWQRDNTPNAGG